MAAFRERFDKWFCRAGWHEWSEPSGPTEMFPLHDRPNPTRSCRHCGERQRWLPGYGGSEVGCWMHDWQHETK